MSERLIVRKNEQQLGMFSLRGQRESGGRGEGGGVRDLPPDTGQSWLEGARSVDQHTIR